MITEEMSIPEIVSKYPQTTDVFKRHGVQVEGYKALEHENLFATARVHHWDLQALLDELKQAIQKNA